MDRLVAKIQAFIRELRRRRVIRVAVVYAGTAFVILQLGEILVEPFGLPPWSLRLVTFLLILGFPLAVGLAWVFDVTEEGLVRTGAEEERGQIDPSGKPFTSNQVLIGLLVVAIGLLLYPRLTGPAEQSSSEEAQGSPAVPEDTATARLGPQSVAVLPFTYLAAGDSSDYFSLGMTDELLSRLAQIEGLSVTARTSVMQYQETEKTIPEIARELGVAHVVEGSVQQSGSQVRIQAQLIDARTGKHLWAEGFTRPFRDVLDLQVDLARRIAEQIELELLPRARRQLSEAPEVDSAAYALYLQGRHLRFRETGKSLTRAVRLLRRSIAIDSTFAPAWATLSTSALLVPAFGGRLPEGLSADSLVRVAARRAVALDSTSAEACIAMGNVFELLDKDHPAAGPWFQKATELNPGLANAQREYGLYLMRMARFEEAEGYLKEAARLDPASPAPWNNLGWSDLLWGNYREARRHLERALTLQPDYWVSRARLAGVYLAQGQMEAALREARRAVEVNLSPWSLAILGHTYARAGQPDSARAALGRMREEFGPSPIQEATIYAALGETDRALGLLEETEGATALKVSPLWKPLRGEPRYERLLEEMGLDEESVRETMKKLSSLSGESGV